MQEKEEKFLFFSLKMLFSGYFPYMKMSRKLSSTTSFVQVLHVIRLYFIILEGHLSQECQSQIDTFD